MYEKTEEKPKEPSFKDSLTKFTKNLFETVQLFVVALAFVVFLYLFIASPHEVIGRSMEDNFHDGEYLIADKVSYKLSEPRRGDVVIFQKTETVDYIKRVIGIPGDTVEVRDGHYYINGEQLNESDYLATDIFTEPGNFLSEGEMYVIPEGKIFVSGDNREHSSDSRAFGPIDINEIKGRAFLVYWPITELKLVSRESYN
ncbi:MAG: signal peptidase I [bacterium]